MNHNTFPGNTNKEQATRQATDDEEERQMRLVGEYYHMIPNKNVSCRIYCDSKAALAG
jgi:hypothetical protein